MSITISRLKENEFRLDPWDNLCVIFKIHVDKDLPEEQAIEDVQKVARFLLQFQDARTPENPDEFNEFNRFISLFEFKEGIKAGKVLSLHDFDTIKVRIGYAQEFQDEFNAEFN